MSEIKLDPYLARYAARTRGMTASEIRALFAVASRPEIISLAGGMPFTAALDYDALQQVTHDVIARNGPTALQYGGGQGLPELREQLVEIMRMENVPAHADDIVVTSGGQQGLDLIAKLFCDPGDVILAEGPTYVGALGAFSAYQADVVHIPMDSQGVIPGELESALQKLRAEGRTAKFFYTIPNHQNPAGVSLSTERRQEVIRIAEEFDLLVLEDNPYGMLDFKNESRPSLRSLAPERVMYLGTLSKILSPGIRVGWIVAAGPVRDKLILLKEAADLCQSNLTQYIAERWFATQPWQRQVDEYRDLYRERCRAMLDEMAATFPSSCAWSEPTGGFFVWATMPPELDTKELLAKALSQRVAYVPGVGFYADGSGKNAMRLAFCYPTAETIREGISRLAKVLHAEIELVQAVYGKRG